MTPSGTKPLQICAVILYGTELCTKAGTREHLNEPSDHHPLRTMTSILLSHHHDYLDDIGLSKESLDVVNGSDGMGTSQARFQSLIHRLVRMADYVAMRQVDLSRGDLSPDADGVKLARAWLRCCRDVSPKVPIATLSYPWGGQHTSRSIMEDLHGRVDHVIDAWETKQHPTNRPYEIFWGGYDLIPTVGLFPFFMLPERRGRWAVIDYGHLETVGLILPKEIHTFLKLRTKKGPGDTRRTHATDFVGRIGKLDERDYKLAYVGLGHASHLILRRYISDGSTLYTFRKVLTDLDSLGVKTTLDAKSKLRTANAEDVRNALVERNVALVSDLGDPVFRQLATAAEHDDDLQVVHVDTSQLRIPVGVGYSLACLPRILRQGSPSRSKVRWQAWLEFENQVKLAIQQSNLAKNTEQSLLDGIIFEGISGADAA